MTNEKTTARRQRRIAARNKQILDAAAQVFADKGYHRATTREIADVADVSEGTIYNYFGSKEDLLIGVMTRLGESEQIAMSISPERLDQALAVSPRDFIRASIRARHDFVVQNRPMLHAVLSAILVDRDFADRYRKQLLEPVVPPLEQHMRARVERGQMRPANVALMVRFLAAVNLGLLGLLIIGDPLLESEWESEDLVEDLVSLVLDGLVPQEEAQVQSDGESTA
jgi:AcrR family transcriptional regulator